MEATIDRLIYFAVGVAIGYILHIIVSNLRAIRREMDEVKEEVDEVLKLERKHDEGGFLSNPVALNITFALLMVFVFYAAYASYQNGRHLTKNAQLAFVQGCTSAQELREVQRRTVDAVYALAIGSVGPQPGDPPLTDIEKRYTNAFIVRSNDFRESTYNKIKPSKACIPYVTDDHVEPPTPPKPLIK